MATKTNYHGIEGRYMDFQFTIAISSYDTKLPTQRKFHNCLILSGLSLWLKFLQNVKKNFLKTSTGMELSEGRAYNTGSRLWIDQ